MHFNQLHRREFIMLLGGAAAGWPLAARAQHERMRRIGVLVPYAENDPEAKARFAAFLQGLQQSGWTDGGNVRIDAQRAGYRAQLAGGVRQARQRRQRDAVEGCKARRSSGRAADQVPSW